MLVISKQEQEKLIDMKEVLQYVEKSLIAFAKNETVTPIRTALPFANRANTALFMPSVSDRLQTLGIKVVNVVPGNKTKNKKVINGIVYLFDINTGEPAALLEGSYITQIRTGALSAVATKYMARSNASILGIIGTGEQAIGLCKAILVVRDIEKVILYNRTEKKAKQFAIYIEKEYGITTEVVETANDVVIQSDVIVTATYASKPIFTNELQKGVHVNAVGSFRPSMQELPSHAIIHAHKVVVESKEAALEETGDLQNPVRKGFDSKSLVELAEIISGKMLGRETEDEVTVFKSVGLAVVDVIVGQYVYEKAKDNGVGVGIIL